MSDGFSGVFHLVGLYSNKLTSGHKANGHLTTFGYSDSTALHAALLEKRK